MPRLLGVDIPADKKTVYSLQYLYGVGPRVARELCLKAGVSPEAQARDLHEDELARMASLLDKDYVVEGQLRMEGGQPVFEATNLLAKCPSKFKAEAGPAEKTTLEL